MYNPKSNRRNFLSNITGKAILGSAAILAGQQALAEDPLSDHTNTVTDYGTASEKKFVPVMLTPFTTDNKIDYKALDALIDFYFAAGVKGFFANCASSEMYNLTPDERVDLTRHVVKRVNGRASVVSTGSFGNTIEEKAEFAKRIYHTGIDAVITISSLMATKEESDDVLIRNYEKFFTLTDNIPMGTYECPSPYKRLLTPKVFSYLLSTNRMTYHKDTALELTLVKEKLAQCKNSRLEFYDAHTPNAMYSLQGGAKGMSAIAGNFYPEIYAWLCQHVMDPKKQKEVEWIQSELTRADKIVGNGYNLSAKYFLKKRGVPIQVIGRSRTTPLTEAESKNMDEFYPVFLSWCERLRISPAKI